MMDEFFIFLFYFVGGSTSMHLCNDTAIYEDRIWNPEMLDSNLKKKKKAQVEE